MMGTTYGATAEIQSDSLILVFQRLRDPQFCSTMGNMREMDRRNIYMLKDFHETLGGTTRTPNERWLVFIVPVAFSEQ